jgi:hypothetical protein
MTITKKQLEEAFPGEDTDTAMMLLKCFDRNDYAFLNEWPNRISKNFGCEGMIANRVSQCSFTNSYAARVDLLLEMLNAVLHCFGVEYIARKEESYTDLEGISYLNTGDTYVATVIYDHTKDEWMISSYGDIVEENPEDFE